MKCIDVSNWQGVITVDNWKKVKKTAPYVMIRCSLTYQQEKFKIEKDKSFVQNIKNANKAGMKIGVYHYSQAISIEEAQKEAAFVIKTIAPYKKYISLPVTIDWEFSTKYDEKKKKYVDGRLNSAKAKKLGKTKCKKIIDAFCKAVKKEGYTPMVYANLSTLTNYISVKLKDSWKIWVAHYARSCGWKYKKYMWQYTEKAKVSGITGNVDMNYIYLPEPKTTAKKK